MFKKNDRTLYVEEISEELKILSKKDLRVGQVFKIIESSLIKNGKDLFNVENDILLKMLKELK